MNGVVVDSGCLTLWAAEDRQVKAILDRVQGAGQRVYVPTVCLVESLSGRASDASLYRQLKGATIVGLAEPEARRAAARRGAVDGDDAAGPVVVETAATLGAFVLTTDPDDLTALAYAAPPFVAVVDPRR